MLDWKDAKAGVDEMDIQPVRIFLAGRYCDNMTKKNSVLQAL